MERRQRPAAHGTWDRPQHPPSFRREAPQYPASQTGSQHGEPHPRVYYPDGGAHRTGPWESRPHEAGRPGSSPHVGSEQRPPHRDNGVDFTPHAYHEPQQHAGPQGMSQLRPLRPEVFPHGGTRPGIPHHGPMQPRLPHGNFNSEGLQSPIIPNNGSDPNMLQHRAPEPPQGVMQYNAPCDGPQQSLCVQSPEVGFQGRPQQIPASSQENVSDHRRESQEVGQRLNNYTNMYQSGERHSNVQQHISDEQQGPMYSERTLPSADLFHQGGPGRGPEPALSRYSSSHLSGRHPGGFQYDLPHNRNNLQHTYQNEGSQPGLSRGSHLNPPPPLDTFPYRTPSPGIQPFPTPLQPAPLQNPPYIDNPQQGHYHLPPVHGSLPNPSYALHPLVGSALGGSLEEGDLEVPRLQRRIHPHHLLNQQQQSIMHQDRRQGLEPLMPSGMTGGQHFDHEAPFPQHEAPDGRRDPNLMLQHGSPFVSQPKPHIEDNFLHLDKQTDIENDGSADKDIFARWLSSFLSCRRKEPATKPDAVQACSIAEARGLIYGALRLVSQLDSMCQALESRNKAGEPWTHDYKKVADIREDLEKRLKELEKPGYIQGVKRKLDRVRRKRLRWQRRRQAAEEEEKEAAERCAEKEASTDLWRMQCIQEVEEKKRERELKATADSVLGEVRKKQNDVKKMLDVLKALEKLRKLRKEAAGRKGVCPPPSADETFTNHIKRLRTMVHKRSALYDAEEKTLRVILEGEQEEERQREKDKRLKKEKEKILQKQRELDSILFGDADPLPSPHPLQPFNQYFLQAEHSVVSLVQIRHEWDTFLVPPDHPDGSSIPRGWVVPTTPSSDTWATALMHSD